YLPAHRNGTDFGLLLGFVVQAFGEEFVHEGLFQLGGGLDDPLLRFDRPLHRRKYVRDLLLLGEWWDGKAELPQRWPRSPGVMDTARRRFRMLDELVAVNQESEEGRFAS